MARDGKQRKHVRHLRVPVTEDEAARIEQRAVATGMSIASYLRAVGMEYSPRSELDQERVQALVKAMADLGRLGGLLKLWLSDDEKLAAYPMERRRQIPETLQEIRRSQAALLVIIQELRP